MARFADMAGQKMRKLRRNWSTTKTDITQTITRIKKKSTASVADLSEVFRMSVATGSTTREDSSPEKELSSPPLQTPTGREQKKKGTWALRQIRRRMTVAQPSGGLSKSKEPSTFYLTLTIEQGQGGNKESSPSETSSPEPAASTPSPLPPLVTPPATAAPTVSKLPVQPRRTSSASSLHYQATVRPKTAPPDPPVRSPSVPDCSPPAAPARNPTSTLSLSKLTVSKSSESLDEQQTQYCDIAIQPYPSSFRKGSSLSSEGSGSNTPYSRLSLASNGTYMSVGDMASGSDIQRPEEVRSYMDLQPPLESEELYISSHFADEPLYQFYTAAIIEVRYAQLNSLFIYKRYKFQY